MHPESVQTAMVTGPPEMLEVWTARHPFYPVHCPACGESEIATARGSAFIRLVLRAHLLCCGQPKVYRGRRQRAWFQRLVAGEHLTIPRHGRRFGSDGLSSSYRVSFEHLIARMEARGVVLARDLFFDETGAGEQERVWLNVPATLSSCG